MKSLRPNSAQKPKQDKSQGRDLAQYTERVGNKKKRMCMMAAKEEKSLTGICVCWHYP